MLLFSVLFAAMETTTQQSEDTSLARPHQMDEDMSKVVPIATLALTEEDIKSDLVDDSFHRKKGMFVQFLNQACPGAPLVIGGIRINCSDIRRAPAYLSRNKRLIKQHATRCLMKHLQDMQSGIGANESLTVDDFGMTFTVASVSPIGALLNPVKRQEGPMFFCHFPALVEPAIVVHSEWNHGVMREGEQMHVINAYISLLPAHQRRHVIITKAKEEKAAIQNAATALAQSSPAKKPKVTPAASQQGSVNPNQRFTQGSQPQRQPREEDKLRSEVANLRQMIHRLQGQVLPSPP